MSDKKKRELPSYHSSLITHHSSLNQLLHFLFAQDAARALGAVVDALDALVGGFEAARFEPVDDVRLAAHRADLDLLAHAEQPRGHARVDEVGQLVVALPEALDDGRRVHP